MHVCIAHARVYVIRLYSMYMYITCMCAYIYIYICLSICSIYTLVKCECANVYSIMYVQIQIYIYIYTYIYIYIYVYCEMINVSELSNVYYHDLFSFITSTFLLGMLWPSHIQPQLWESQGAS